MKKLLLFFTVVTLANTGHVAYSMKETLNEQLFKALQQNNTEEAEKLINAGANVNSKDELGVSPLHWAALNNNSKLVRFLLKNGANVNSAAVDGDTPLQTAVILGHTDIVKLLLDSGADPSIADNLGTTPLDVAKKDEIKAILLAHITPKEVESFAIQFLMVLKRKETEGEFPGVPKDVRKLLIRQALIEDRLEKAKKHLPNYDEDKLSQAIEKGVKAA